MDKLAAMAAARGEAIGILDTPLPWTRMRAAYALIGLAAPRAATRWSRRARLPWSST
jgi:hypothetical protein